MSSDRIDVLSRSLADGTSRRSLLRMLGIGVAGTAVAGTGVARIGLNDAQAKTFHKLHNIPVSDKGGGKSFRGKLSVVRFEQKGQGIVAVGKLTGKLTDEDGDKKRISRNVEMPVELPGFVGVQSQAATCEILDLIIRPIDLNLLGLHLHIDTIHVNLTATRGGGLLGDLLCAIADLLNGGNPLGQLAQIVSLLNQILGVLRQL